MIGWVTGNKRVNSLEFDVQCTCILNNIVEVQNILLSISLYILPDGMLINENEALRDRVDTLEKKVHSQEDEIICLKSALSDVIRRMGVLESTRGKYNTVRPHSIGTPVPIRSPKLSNAGLG